MPARPAPSFGHVDRLRRHLRARHPRYRPGPMTPPAPVPDDPALSQKGRWDPVFALPDVAIHTHPLPTGKVLSWGRRKDPNGGMNQQGCAPFVWDPVTGSAFHTVEPQRADGTPVNL